ncbi:MAG TPA: hypothetical protein VH083_17530 [Myxococcales bacterium]|jgi:hypothetical protein|nr:hypothetical protein [Myxococcales bacterium]
MDEDLDRLLRESLGPVPQASPGLRRRVLAAIDSRPRRWPQRAILALAACVLLALGFWQLRPKHPPAARRLTWVDEGDDEADETALFDLAAFSAEG